MFFGDKNKLAQAIISRVKPESAESMEDEKKELAPVMEDLRACAEEIIDAIHGRDVDALVEAMAAFDEIHDNMEEEHESEEGEYEEKSVGEKIVG